MADDEYVRVKKTDTERQDSRGGRERTRQKVYESEAKRGVSLYDWEDGWEKMDSCFCIVIAVLSVFLFFAFILGIGGGGGPDDRYFFDEPPPPYYGGYHSYHTDQQSPPSYNSTSKPSALEQAALEVLVARQHGPLDASLIDPNTSACDDFVKHSCSPQTRHKLSCLEVARERALRVVGKMMRSLEKKTATGVVHELYTSCTVRKSDDKSTTWDSLDESISSMSDTSQLGSVMGSLAAYQVDSAFALSVQPSLTNGRERVIMLEKAGALSVNRHAVFKNIPIVKNRYSMALDLHKHFSTCLSGLSDHQLAEYADGQYQKRDSFLSVSALEEFFTHNEIAFNITEYLSKSGALSAKSISAYWLYETPFFGRCLKDAIIKFSLPQWKAYLHVALRLGTGSDKTDSQEDQASAQLVSQLVSTRRRHYRRFETEGKRGRKMDAFFCTDIVWNYLQADVEREYLALVLNSSTVKHAQETVKGAVDFAISWLGNITGSPEASFLSKKLKKAILRVAHVGEGTSVQIANNTYADNLLALKKEQLVRAFSDSAPPVPQMPAHIPNAYYDPLENSINVMAGFLQEPLYSQAYEREFVAARLGSAVFHEISHGADSVGKNFDETGKLGNWIAAPCVSPYSDEDFADRLGMHMAEAWLGEPPKRSFYESYAQMWCSKQAFKTTTGDVHSSAFVRITAPVTHLSGFNSAFECAPSKERRAPFECSGSSR